MRRRIGRADQPLPWRRRCAMAFIARCSVTPKVEHAATGANESPVIFPRIEICAAGVL